MTRRVLHVDSGRDMRGGQWQALQLTECLRDESLLLCLGDGPLMKAARERGVEAHPLTASSLFRSSRQASLTHAHDARSHTWAATLAGSPLVVSRRVAFPPGQSFVSRWKYTRPAHFIAVSQHVGCSLQEAGVPADKISVVYDGVKLPGWTADGENVVAVATEDPMKGSALLREAASIAGVSVIYSRDLERDLRTAALFVYITQSEGLGSAALLAMAAGIPVVASNVGGLPEIVEHGVTGLLTDNQPQAIATAIRRALDERSSMCCNAQKAVAGRFTTEIMAQETVRVYEKVLS
ncbi:MAG: glycosyltransferase family 4 protein [Bryobacteraceae bacterium]